MGLSNHPGTWAKKKGRTPHNRIGTYNQGLELARENSQMTKKEWRLFRRLPNRGPLDHATGEGYNENDPSMTRAVRHRMHRVFWNLQGKTPPPMDADGRPLD